MNESQNQEKSHHSISQVLSLLTDEHPQLTISKIRFLESRGLISPERTSSGYRKYHAKDIERLHWILVQQRDRYLPLKEIKRRLEETPDLPESLPSITGDPRETEEKTLIGLTPEESTLEESTLDQQPQIGQPDDDRTDDQPAKVKPLLFSSQAHDDKQKSDPTRQKTHTHQPLSSSASLTASDLAQTMDVPTELVAELQRLGLIVPIHNTTGTSETEPVFDHEALVMLKSVLEFAARGVPARNLRMYKIAADREAGVYQQIVATLIARGNRTRLRQELEEIIELAETMRRSLLRSNLTPYLD